MKRALLALVLAVGMAGVSHSYPTQRIDSANGSSWASADHNLAGHTDSTEELSSWSAGNFGGSEINTEIGKRSAFPLNPGNLERTSVRTNSVGAANALPIEFTKTDLNTPYSLTQVTNVSSSVSEPASLLMVGSGLILLASIGRKMFLKN